MSGAVSTRGRRFGLLLTIAVLGLQALFGAPAMAQGGYGCSNPPDPEYPGSGAIVGALDPPTAGNGIPGTAYEDVSYAGLVWHTYGYDGPCAMSDPFAGADTYVGNVVFNIAKSLTAATNGLHFLVQDGGPLAQLDDFITVATVDFYDSVFTPYVALALVLTALVILYRTLHGDLAAIGRKTLYVFAGLWLASTTYLTPMIYTHISDEILVHGAGELQGRLLHDVGGANVRSGLPTMLHEQTVVQPWQQGEFGSTTTPQAQQFSQPLWQAQACTKVDTLRGNCDVQSKQASYTNIATQLKGTPANPYFTGSQHSRTGAGAMALIRAVAYDSFQLVAKAGVLLAQIVIRVVIVGGPVLGLLAILHNNALPMVIRSIGNAIAQGLILVAASAGHVYVMGWVLRPDLGLSALAQLTIMTLVTVVLWLAIRPSERLGQMTASTVGISMPNWAQRRQTRAMRAGRRRDRARRGFGRVGRWFRGVDQRVEAAGRDADADIDDDAVEGGPESRQAVDRPEGFAEQARESATTARRRAQFFPRASRAAPSSDDTTGTTTRPGTMPRPGAESTEPSGRPATATGKHEQRTEAGRTGQQPAPTGSAPSTHGQPARRSEPQRPQQREQRENAAERSRSSESTRKRPRRLRPRQDGVYPGAVEGGQQERQQPQRPESDQPLWSEQEE